MPRTVCLRFAFIARCRVTFDYPRSTGMLGREMKAGSAFEARAKNDTVRAVNVFIISQLRRQRGAINVTISG